MTSESLSVLALACLERGQQHQRRGEIDLALAAYGEAVRLGPALARPYHCRGRLLAGRRLYDQAVADFTRAIGLAPADPAAYNDRGVAHAARGDFAAAAADFGAAL